MRHIISWKHWPDFRHVTYRRLSHAICTRAVSASRSHEVYSGAGDEKSERQTQQISGGSPSAHPAGWIRGFEHQRLYAPWHPYIGCLRVELNRQNGHALAHPRFRFPFARGNSLSRSFSLVLSHANERGYPRLGRYFREEEESRDFRKCSMFFAEEIRIYRSVKSAVALARHIRRYF